jgi:hypothetical protein
MLGQYPIPLESEPCIDKKDNGDSPIALVAIGERERESRTRPEPKNLHTMTRHTMFVGEAELYFLYVQ